MSKQLSLTAVVLVLCIAAAVHSIFTLPILH